MSVTRVVMVKLDAAHGTEARRLEVARHSLEVLRKVPGIEGVEVGVPTDEGSAAAWDLSILVRFARAEDIEPYLTEATHRAYVDEYLSPRMAVIKAWNFETL
jgi:antibiotic biosynthesis monooxygenase (ABM) superfamily enzyme